MTNDCVIIKSITPSDLIKLMQETGTVTVQESCVIDGKPVIHASLVKANAMTGEQLAGGVPFSVVLQRNATDKGYTNVSVGAIVPAAELGIVLPPDFFNFSNQRLRFVRVYPVDAQSFAVQMDLVLRHATREYVKFAFGLWGSLFSQLLFELIGKGKDTLAVAAEAYAAAHKPHLVVAAVANDSVPEECSAPDVETSAAAVVTAAEASPEKDAHVASAGAAFGAVAAAAAVHEAWTQQEPAAKEAVPVSAAEVVAEPVIAETTATTVQSVAAETIAEPVTMAPVNEEPPVLDLVHPLAADECEAAPQAWVVEE